MIKSWIEAMRLRTLPVSLAGVTSAWALCIANPAGYDKTVIILCFIFALLAQIASNFANEYYDFKKGLDKPGRVGPRRGVTEGDISPRAMLTATFSTLAVACIIGLFIAAIAGWWLIGAGILIAIAVLAYSTGPYPLSHHALGEVAVFFFFGIIPVNLSVYAACGVWSLPTLLTSAAIGLMGSNVLIVNNYRDADADRLVGKRTMAVVLGRKVASAIYLLNGIVAVFAMSAIWQAIPAGAWIAGAYLGIHFLLWHKLTTLKGTAINPVLGMTAVAMFAYSLMFLISILLSGISI